MKVQMMRFMAMAVALISFNSQSLAYSPNPVIGVVAKGMRLLKPIFQLEAQIQAATLGSLSKVDKESVVSEIDDLKQQHKALVYTYGLSPFSSEAVNILKSTGYEFKNIELGLEWFLLGGKESVMRVALSEEVDDRATSLPKIFIGGKCIGGCSELIDLKESGELENMLRQARAKQMN
jgi:Glutaredoxin and related proteins